MKILITGSKGQLGSEINAISSYYPDFRFIFTDVEELDITNKNEVGEFFKRESPDICINCAAYTAVDKAEDEVELSMKINQDAAIILAESCLENNTRLIHISTDYVFDGTNFKPYNENDKPSPASAYGHSKYNGEKSVQRILPDAMIIRTSWLYSAFGNNFLKTMIRLSGERSEIGVVSDQVGSPTNAADLARAILDIIKKNDKQKLLGIYHYSNEGVISWYDFAIAIMEIIGSKCKIISIESKDFPAKAKRPFYSVLNKAKIKKDFKLDIPYWKDSLKQTINKLNKQ